MLIGVVEWRGGDQHGGSSVVVVGKIDRFFVCVCVFFPPPLGDYVVVVSGF